AAPAGAGGQADLERPEAERRQEAQPGHRHHRESHARPDDVKRHEEVVETEIGSRPGVASGEVDHGPEGEDRGYAAEEEEAADPVRFVEPPLAAGPVRDEAPDPEVDEPQEQGDVEGAARARVQAERPQAAAEGPGPGGHEGDHEAEPEGAEDPPVQPGDPDGGAPLATPPAAA